MSKIKTKKQLARSLAVAITELEKLRKYVGTGIATVEKVVLVNSVTQTEINLRACLHNLTEEK